ncbi:MAG: ABC transporter substrate-binding protein [Defluviitaleaceae bacterium]|nr:ABC transporter substrate-binding protein [Defluviitaleaceae bacterium]
MKKGILAFVAVVLVVVFAACAGNNVSRPDFDRDGNPIALPDEINTIISIGPSNSEVLAALGFGGNIIYTDFNSIGVEGVEGYAVLDMMALDAELIINAQPDVVFVTAMSRGGGEDPLRVVSDMGICVIYIPTSTSIAEIQEDIRFIASVMGVANLGDDIIANMQAEIDEIASIAAGITTERSVYFEISAAPWMFSTGTGTFLNEMIEIVGATNIFADHDGWLGVSDEQLLAANPDVILTNVEWMDDPITEILERPGFDAITAVQNGDVFSIAENASSRSSHNIVIALRQIAEAVFPEYFR